MKAESNPQYLKSVQEAVVDFRASFVQFLALHEDGYGGFGRGIAPAVTARADADPAHLEGLRATVGQAAGRALKATSITNAYMAVQGIPQPVDPIAVWFSVTQPKPVLEPVEILASCDSMIGRLDALILKATASAPPEIGPNSMHPVVWGAAQRLWDDGHHRQAVTAAAEALVGQLKAITGRRDVADTALWQECFADKEPVAGKPRLRWPGAQDDRDVKNMNDGLRNFAPGVQMTIRNSATHDQSEMPAQEALERLATLSLLARWAFDECEVRNASA